MVLPLVGYLYRELSEIDPSDSVLIRKSVNSVNPSLVPSDTDIALFPVCHHWQNPRQSKETIDRPGPFLHAKAVKYRE